MIKKKDMVMVTIPQNFDVATLVPAAWRSDKRERWINSMHYILHLLRPDIINKKRRKEYEETGFLSLNADRLNVILGKDYNSILSNLTKAGVIVTNNKYVVGKKSTGYRLASKYLKNFKKVEITRGGIADRLIKREEDQQEKQEKRQKPIQHVTQWLSKQFITIDIDALHDYIESYGYLMNLKLKATSFSSTKKEAEANQRIFLRTDAQIRIAKAIHQGLFKTHRDKAGRLYALVSSMKSELRPFLSLDGEEVSSIDIKSSQPYLFQYIMQKDFWRTTGKLPITLYKHNRDTYNLLKSTTLLKDIIMFGGFNETLTGTAFEGNSFKKINWENDFYQQLQYLISSNNSPALVQQHFGSRSKVKHTMMLLLYQDFAKRSTPYYNAFKKVFSAETELMDLIKTAGPSVFPNILVNVEATLVLEMITKELNQHHPTMPLLTVHDSIICKSKDVETVKGVMKDVLTKVIGTAPGLKVERLNKTDVLNRVEETVDEDWNELLTGVRSTKEAEWMEAAFGIHASPLLYQFPFVKGFGKMLSTRFVDPDAEIFYLEE